MNDNCEEELLSFCIWKYPKFGHFQYESHFRRERAIGTSNLSKSSTENLPTGNFLGHHEEIFLSLIVQYIFGGNFYAILEFYREEEAFCLGRIACFGPLNISRLFGQLWQHQAHAVNH